MSVDEIIENARRKYPATYEFKGELTAEDFNKLKSVCDIKVPTIYMNSCAVYYIRYRR